MLRTTAILTAGVIAILATASFGQQSPQPTPVAFEFNGVTLSITQSASTDTTRLAQLSRIPDGCTNLCLAPSIAAVGVATITETEVMTFIAQDVASGRGLLIDSRQTEDRDIGMIATSVSLPHDLLQADNPFRPQILVAMGARQFQGLMNFADAMPIVVYDNGPLNQDAVLLIEHLREAGYPATKIQYYRGGLQVWTALGLSVEETTS